MRKPRRAAVALALALLSVGCRSSSTAPSSAAPRYRDPSLAADVRAEDLVARMTAAEKVSQLMTTAPAIARLGVPAYDWWNEALHGVARAGRATVFPQAIALAATFDERLVHEVADVISDEARAKYNEAIASGERGRYHGLTFFTPNLNIFRDPRWGRGQETFGEDPLLTARMGVAFITGMQGDDPHYAKTIATAKHFAVHSGPEASRHVFDARPTIHDLVDTYLPQFEAAVREGRVGSVMAAYNRLDGLPCAANPWLLGGTLSGEWGFGGYVVGDCGAVEDIFATHRTEPSPEAAAASALLAGTDLDCGRGYAALGSALVRGLVREADLDHALVRLFTARFRLGLFDPPARVPWSNLGPRTIESPAHLALARRAAARSIVLLENRENTLPLGPSVRSLAVVGPTADDVPVLLGNYHGTPSHPVPLLDGVRAAARARGVSVTHARGARLLDTSDGDIADAVAAARGADVVIAVVGLDPRLEGEERDARLNRAGDRTDIRLPPAQERLLHALGETGRPLVVVLTGGSALAVPWASVHAAALLDVFYPGAEGGNALADVLFGAVDPAGRLPFTMYREIAYLPHFDDYGMMGRTYRYIDLPPLYPFGFGRSYTTFRYSNLETALAAARAGTVTVEVANTGLRTGDEVVEVYIVPRERPPYAPYRWLAAFTRITLTPGEHRRVQLAIPAAALTTVDDKGVRRPLTGDVSLAVGGGQPDTVGRYADEVHGVSATVRLGGR